MNTSRLPPTPASALPRQSGSEESAPTAVLASTTTATATDASANPDISCPKDSASQLAQEAQLTSTEDVFAPTDSQFTTASAEIP